MASRTRKQARDVDAASPAWAGRRWLCVLLACGLPAGCSIPGGGGDPWSEPNADPYGTGLRITDLTGPATWLQPSNQDSVGCGIPGARQISLSGSTITAIDRFDETGGGAIGNLYLQDAQPPSPPAYSGMTVFRPTTSPPDLRVVPGDVVDLFGFFTEFAGPQSSPFPYCRSLPELSGAMSFRFEAAPAVPHLIAVSELGSYDTARKWLGLLVKVKNVTMSDNPFESSSGRYSIRIDAGKQPPNNDIPSITNELFDLKNGPALVKDQTVKSVTGIVTFFYGVHLSPRNAADIEP